MPRGGKHRLWSAEEKRSICRETRAPGVSVAQVARRHALNANLIFKWLKDPRFALVAVVEEKPVFLPGRSVKTTRPRFRWYHLLPTLMGVSRLSWRPGIG
jgi:transposase-like protein